MRKSNPAAVAEHCIDAIRKAAGVADGVRAKLRQRDSYASRNVDRKLLLSAISAAGIAFLAGVVLPLFTKNLHPAVYLWLPVAVYTGAFFLVITLVDRQLSTSNRVERPRRAYQPTAEDIEREAPRLADELGPGERRWLWVSQKMGEELLSVEGAEILRQAFPRSESSPRAPELKALEGRGIVRPIGTTEVYALTPLGRAVRDRLASIEAELVGEDLVRDAKDGTLAKRIQKIKYDKEVQEIDRLYQSTRALASAGVRVRIHPRDQVWVVIEFPQLGSSSPVARNVERALSFLDNRMKAQDLGEPNQRGLRKDRARDPLVIDTLTSIFQSQ